jgi:anti-sigma factor RsiW
VRRARCEDVEALLPLHVAGELGWRERRRVARHLRRCERCAAAEEHQRHVSDELGRIGRAAAEPLDEVEPPADLLDTLLEQAREPGLVARAAVPARGAVSGARPGLSVALVLALLAVAALAGWTGWRIGTAVRDRRPAGA